MADKFKRTRDASERSLSKKLAKALAATKKKILSLVDGAVANPIDDVFWDGEAAILGTILNEELLAAGYDAIDAELVDITYAGIDVAVASAEVNEVIAKETFNLVAGINATSRKTIQAGLDAYFAGEGITIGELSSSLTGTFGASRAEGIAVTEVTRAYSAGQESVLKGLADTGIEVVEVWNTNEDELVCTTCGPRDNKERGDGWDDLPPAHPRCRCWTSLEIKDRKKALSVLKNSLRGEAGRDGIDGKTEIVNVEVPIDAKKAESHEFLGSEHTFPSNLKPGEVLIADKSELGFRRLELDDLPEIESRITQVFQNGGAPNDIWELKDVTITDVQADDILSYNGTVWQNQDYLCLHDHLVFEDEGSGLPFGEIYLHDGSTPTTVPTGDTYVKIDQFTTSGLYNHCTPDPDNDQLVLNVVGKYHVTASVSLFTDTPQINVIGAVFLNGVEQNNIHFRRYITTANDEGVAGFNGLVDVTTSGWALDIRARHDSGGDVDVTFTYANLSVTMIGGT